MNGSPEARSVEAFELERYLGLWYEIGRLPLRYEDDEAIDVTAEYSLNEDGTVKVDNRCLDKDREPTQAIGQAQPDVVHDGRLQVSFLPEGLRWIPFTRADYWVLRVDGGETDGELQNGDQRDGDQRDDRYRTALVGTPDHKYLWLLARDPQIDPMVEQQFLAEATRQGYSLEGWIRTPQSGGRVTDDQV